MIDLDSFYVALMVLYRIIIVPVETIVRRGNNSRLTRLAKEHHWFYVSKKKSAIPDVAYILPDRKPRTNAALHHLIAVYYFCSYSGFKLLTPQQIGKLLGIQVTRQVPYIVDKKGQTLYRTYICSGEMSSINQQTHQYVDDLQKMHPSLVKSRQLGLLILAQTASLCHHIKEEVIDKGKLLEKASVLVRLGPSPASLKFALERWKHDA